MPGEFKNRPPLTPDGGSAEKQNKPEQNKTKGSIVRWNKEKGFGFIRLADGRNVFCHISELCEHLRPPRGQDPDFSKPINVAKVVQKEKGSSAEQVECDSCAVPEQWEMRPKGEPIFGVYELEPICVNKPNTYKSRPDYEVISAANEPFRQAQEKQRRWNSSLSQNFFDEFGEPQSIEVSKNNNLALSYSHGVKEVWMSDAMDSGHWKVSPSGQWKQSDYSVEGEFVFDDIPGAKAWRAVASLGTQPHLEKQFDLLPATAQEEVLKVVREKIQPPGTIAAERVQDFIDSEYSKARLSEIRDDIVALQAPGEAIVHSERRKYTEYYGESPDERRPAGSYETEGTFYHLTTGVRKGKETNTYWRYNPKGVKTFSISQPAAGETGEMVRDRLLAAKRQELKSQFESAKQIKPPAPDTRLYSLTPEQWTEQYNQEWQQLQAQVEASWQAEEQQKLGEMRSQYEAYEKSLDEISADITRLSSILGKYPYSEFRKDYSASRAQAEEYASKLSNASSKLEHRTGGIGADIVPEPEEAKALVEEVSQAIETLRPAAEIRGQEEARLKPLLAEVETVAAQKLGRKNAWQYGMGYEEQQELSHRLERAKKMIEAPQSVSDEILDIPEIEKALLDLKQILESKKPVTKVELQPETGTQPQERKEFGLNERWTEMVTSRDSRFVRLLTVNGNKIVQVAQLEPYSRDIKFADMEFKPGQPIEVGKSSRAFIIDPKRQNKITANWGGRDAFTWEFDEDGLYAFGRDISPILIVKKLEDGTVIPEEEIDVYGHLRRQASQPPASRPSFTLPADNPFAAKLKDAMEKKDKKK